MIVPQIAATSTAVSAFEEITATVTKYSAIESCDYPSCPMASGKRVYIGAVACPRRYKLGTVVTIEGKKYTCEDRTASRFDGRFDIFAGFDQGAYQESLKWGKRSLEVSISL